MPQITRIKWARQAVIISLMILVVLVGSVFVSRHGLPIEPTYTFLQDDPCALPCWEHIVPGESSELDALRLLIKGNLIGDFADFASDDWLSFQTQTGDEVSIFLLNEIVRQIDYFPDQPLLLSAIIEKFGKPDKVYVDIVGEHEICHEASLYYPVHGLRIKVGRCERFRNASNLETVNVMPDSSVLTLSFVRIVADSESMLQLFNEKDEKVDETARNMVEWNGYGYYPP
jgi:hypothetical protein